MFTNLVHICCGECGIDFGVPAEFDRERRGNSRLEFYCPNGHVRVYRETEADQLRRERDQLKQRIAQKDDEIAYQRQHREAAEKSISAHKGQITKLKKRARAGVCPCCFEDLSRHMATKHPTFGSDDENVVPLRKAGAP